MSVGLVTAVDFTGVWLVTGVNMHVLLSIGRIGKLPITVEELAFKWLFTCKQRIHMN